MDDYSAPVVMGPNGGDPTDPGVPTPYGVQWIAESHYVFYSEIAAALMLGLVVQVIVSQVDLTP